MQLTPNDAGTSPPQRPFSKQGAENSQAAAIRRQHGFTAQRLL